MAFAGGLVTLELGLLGGTAMTHLHQHQGQDIFITEQLHQHWGMCQWNVTAAKWRKHTDLHNIYKDIAHRNMKSSSGLAEFLPVN